MLTKQQDKLWRYIHSYLEDSGGEVSPSYAEMAEALGLGSKSEASRLVMALKERGYIFHMPYRSRGIRIIKVPWELDDQIKSKLGAYGDRLEVAATMKGETLLDCVCRLLVEHMERVEGK